LGTTRRRHEFHRDRVWTVHLDDGTEIATAKAMRWKVVFKYDDIERLRRHFAPPG
jgi:hypothetical protein